MKRFSYTNIYSTYLSAALFMFCCTAVLYPRDRSVHKPIDACVNQCESCNLFPANRSELKSCLKSVLDQQADKLLAACSSSAPCDQRVAFSSPITITQSGRYCLLADLNVLHGSAITVAAGVSDVVLDLNNHTVSGTSAAALIDIVGGASNRSIAIINGTVKPLGSDTVGIRAQNASEVVVSGLSLRGNNDTSSAQRGILLSGVTDFRVNNCFLTQIGFVPLELNSCSLGKVTYCSVFDNINNASNVGLVETASCQDILFEKVSVDNNSEPTAANNASRGFSVSNQSSGVSFLQCTHNNNVNRQQGFAFFDSTDCICRECEASNNTRLGESAGEVDAFLVSNSARITWDACIANNNSTEGTGGNGVAGGFRLLLAEECCTLNCLAKGNFADPAGSAGRGFVITGEASNNYLRNNIAISNNGEGFSGGGTNNVFFSNYAKANGTNYTNVQPVVMYLGGNDFSADVSAWSNISV